MIVQNVMIACSVIVVMIVQHANFVKIASTVKDVNIAMNVRTKKTRLI